MWRAGESFENPRTGTRIEVHESTPQRVVFDRTYPPGTGKADAHLHLDLFQSWQVLSGRGQVVLDGETRDVGPGETVEVATGTAHRDIYNPHREPLTVHWVLEPVNEFVGAFADCYRHYLTRDELNGQDEFKALQLFPILRATRAQSWLASMPIALQRPVIAAGAGLGRLRGYRARY